MATVRNIAIRLSVQDNETVRRALEQLGEDGKKALERIEKGSNDAVKGLQPLGGAANIVNDGFQNMAARAGPLGQALSAIGPAGLGAAAAIGALTVGLKASFEAAAEAEKLQLRLGAVLKATGNAAGFTQSQINDFASGLQDSLKINDEKIIESISVLATFRAVSGDTFKQATVLAADMAAVFGGDMTSASLQLGKALQDPVQGLSALRRVGVTFSEDQQELIKSLVETGEVARAQKVILGELENQIGGAAAAEAGGTAGATRGLANAWDDLLENVGKTQAVAGPAGFALEVIESVLKRINSAFQDTRKEIDNNLAVLNDPAYLAFQEKLKINDEVNRDPDGVEALAKQIKLAAERNKLRLEEQKQLEQFQKLREEGEKKAEADAKKSADAEKKRLDEREKAFEKLAKYEQDRYDAAAEADKQDDARSANLKEYIDELGETIRLGGLSAEAREEELAVLKAQKIIQGELNEGDETRIRTLARQQIAQEAAQKAAEESAQEWNRIWDQASDNIQDSLAGAFRSALDGSLKSSKDFAKAFKNLMLDTVAQIAAAMVFKPVIGGVFNAIGLGSGSASGGGGSGALGLAGNGASLGNFLSGGSLTSGVGNFLFGAAPSGAADIANIGAAGFSFNGSSGLLASGGFAGSGIATALPYIGAGVAALGILRGIGVIGPGKSVGPNAGGQLIEQGGVFAVGPTGADNGGNVAGVTQELTQAVSVLNALARGIGVAQLGDGLASYIDTFGAGGIRNAADLIKDAIAKGVIEGLTEGEKSLLAASQDLNATAQGIITNRLLPGQLASQRLQIENPQQFALDAAKAERDAMAARIAEIEDGGKALADLEFIYQSKIADIHKQFAGAVGDAMTNAIEIANLRLNFANDNLSAASRVLLKAVDAERNSITTRYNAALKVSQTALDGLTSTVQRLTGVASLLKGAIPDIPGLEGPNRVAGQAALSAALSAARAGGALPDEDALRDALDAVAKPSEQLFSTFLDYQRDFIRTANDISNLSDIADWQRRKADLSVTTAQAMLDQDRLAYEGELARLDGILSGSQAQIDAVNGTTIAVMSIADAIAALGQALTQVTGARQAVDAADPIEALYRRIFNRASDAPGKAFWQQQLDAGASIAGIENSFMTIKQMGGFANGGFTPANEPFIVGEKGPEIMRLPMRGHITSNAKSFDNSALVSEIKGLRSDMQSQALSIARLQLRMAQLMERWDSTGIPETRLVA